MEKLISNYSMTHINHTFLKYGVRIQRHENYVSSVDESSCAHILQVASEHRCRFVKETPSCSDYIQIINYMELFFCDMTENDTGMIVGLSFIMILLSLYLFLMLAITSEYIFCPVLAVIAKVLHLSESIAGVTILAFGNAAADILGTLMDVDEDTPMIYTEMLGTGLFITCMVSGCICLINPFFMRASDLIRDILFYLFAILWLFGSIADECVELWEAISLLGIYLVYFIVVVISHIRRHLKLKHISIRTGVKATIKMPSKVIRKSISIAPLRHFRFQQTDVEESSAPQQMSAENENENINIFKDFLDYMKPITKDEWKALSLWYKILGIFKIPIILTLRLLLPVVDYECPKHGWCKLLNSLQCIITPLFVIAALDFASVTLFSVVGFEIKIWYFIIVLGSIPMTIMLIKTQVRTQPKYHDLIALVSFISTTTTIHFLSEEIESIVTTLGLVMELSNDFFGLTALSWGNGMGDLVSNISIARQGLQKMAFSACYGGPMLTTILAAGIGFIIRALNSPQKVAKIRPGVFGKNCLVFLSCTLVSTAFMISITRFQARISHGIFLMILYSTFMLYCTLAEMQVIHPYGTDHNPEPEQSIRDILLDIV